MKKLLSIALLLTFCSLIFAKGDTYTYDHWTEMEKSPDVYRVSHVIYSDDLNLGSSLKNPNSLYAHNDLLYILDTDNNRIVELRYTEDKKLELVRVIDHFNGNGKTNLTTFNKPMDMFINKDGSYFIADTENGRVVKVDKDLNYLLEFVEPDDPTYEKGSEFRPEKVVADAKGRVYLLARNINKGFLKYEFDGEFQGFYGATDVIFNFIDMIWKRLATKAQREQMDSFVPTEYSNAYMDKDGFIYAVTTSFEEWDLKSDVAKPIRRLNALGKDILVKNADNLPIGDLKWGEAAGIKGPAKFTDITVLDNDVYCTIDRTHGRVFAYDNQGYLLYAFGGRGSIDGYFNYPVSIEHIGKDLFVLDNMNASITVFTPTEYCSLIYKAIEQYSNGEYDDSAVTWEKVLKYNGNYDLAYIGLGKSYLRKNQYKEAMDCFKIKRARKNYSKAYQYYRKEWIEAHLGWIFAIVAALIIIPAIVRKIKAIKRELQSL